MLFLNAHLILSENRMRKEVRISRCAFLSGRAARGVRTRDHSAMWFVTDGGFVVTLLGIALMLAGVGLCLSNMHEWLGASMASGILATGLLVLSVLTASAHWYTMTTNPGTVPKYVHVLAAPASDDADAEHVPLQDEGTTLHCDLCDAARPRWYVAAGSGLS